MTAKVHTFPGSMAAHNALKADTAEQRQAARDCLGIAQPDTSPWSDYAAPAPRDTAPEDLLWAEPGSPQLYRCMPVRPGAVEVFSAASTAAVIFAAGWVAGIITMVAVL